MPRPMPKLDHVFADQADASRAIARAGEITRASSLPGSPPYVQWPISRIEAVYELAFLRIFIAWEMFLEASFYRRLCGYVVQLPTIAGAPAESLLAAPYPTIKKAESAVLGNQFYIAWYNVDTVLKRCQSHVANGRHESVFASNYADLKSLGYIRHRIAHGTDDAKKKFDSATNHLTGSTYPGSRPGRFLRAKQPNVTPKRSWLDGIADQLIHLAGQIT
jgi:hypothetical protein